MEDAADALLRQAVADGTVSAADLEGFGQLDYAGVVRVLKLDAGFSEAVVAVKLQEIDGAALLAMHPARFASALQMTKPEQGKRLETFLSAVRRVAQDHTGSAAVPPAGIAGTKKKRATQETEPYAASMPLKKKKSADSRGLQAPRVSGLKRPLPSQGVAACDATASPSAATAAAVITPPTSLAAHTSLTLEAAPTGPPVTVASTASKTAAEQTVASTDVQHQQPEPIALQESKPGGSAAGTPKETRKQKRNKDKKPGKKKKAREVPQRQQKQQQHQDQQQEPARESEGSRERRGKLLAWGISVLALKHKFDTGVTQQILNKSKRALVSTTGFAEGAGVQAELPSLVRRLGPIDGSPAAFEWKPQAPEKITHLICSDSLSRPTVKLYFALASGALILKEDFLREAKRKRVWPDPRQFQRADFPSFEERERSRWLLRGLPVCVDGPYRAAGLSKQQLQVLVAAVGGSLSDKASASLRLLEDLDALRRRRARGLWGSQETPGARKPAAVSSQWLLDCITSWHCIQVDQHSLDLSYPPNPCSNKDFEVTKQKVPQKAKRTKGRNKQIEEDETAKDCAPNDSDTFLPQSERATEAQREGQEPHLGQQQKPRQQRQKKGVCAPGGDMDSCRQSKPKKRITGKGRQTAEEAPHKGAISCDGNAGPSPADEMEDESVLLSKVNADTKSTKQTRTGGAEAGSGSIQPWSPGSKKACGGAQVDAKDEPPSSPADSDWGAPEEAEITRNSPHCDERNARILPLASPVCASPAEAVEERSEILPRDSATLLQSAAATGILQPLAGELEVAGLFEPDDEKDVGDYDFDLGEHASLSKKDLGLCNKGSPAKYELESNGRLGTDKNLPCTSTNSP